MKPLISFLAGVTMCLVWLLAIGLLGATVGTATEVFMVGYDGARAGVKGLLWWRGL